ncbi:MAG: biotin--[acetyl-CoA-carboxylase] ligase [Candidatus Thorarchaeota archaeon]
MDHVRTEHISLRPVLLDTISSTNDVARELVSQGAGDWLLVMARTQTRGRGRRNRSWISPEGGLYMSLTLRPPLADLPVSLLTILAGCGVHCAIEKLTGLSVCLKWPNDVLCRGLKLAGILCELMTEPTMMVIVGIGVNVNVRAGDLREELRGRATSLLEESGSRLRVEAVAGRIISEIASRVELVENEGSYSSVLDEWRSINCTLGRIVVVNDVTTQQGLAVDIDDVGRLVVQTDEGRLIAVEAGDIEYV